MIEDQKPRIAPPPSVDDVLSSLLDDSRIGQVDFGVALASDPASPSTKTDVGANRPDDARARSAAGRRSAHIATAPGPAPAPPVVEEPVADEPVAERPVKESKSAKVKKVRPPKAAQPKPQPVPEPVAEPVAEVVPEPEPEPEPELEPIARIIAEPEPEPEPEPVTAPAPAPAPRIDVAREVEEVAESVIARIRAAEDATLRHLDSMQVEATRRYELVTAQAELDAELIRLQSRREAHAIISTARMRTGEVDDLHDDPGDTGHRLAVFGDAVSRVADSTESMLAARQRTPERPHGS